MPPADNPLSLLDDDTLWNSHLLLNIECNRGRWSKTRKRIGNLCALGIALEIEAARRGVPAPTSPYNIGKLKGAM